MSYSVFVFRVPSGAWLCVGRRSTLGLVSGGGARANKMGSITYHVRPLDVEAVVFDGRADKASANRRGNV